MKGPSVYYKNLNGLRFFAALSVIIYHVFGVEVLNGHLGVILFFVLSGFLITSLLMEETYVSGTINIKYFLLRRCLRIWPLYFLIVGIAALLLALHFQGHNFMQFTSTVWYYIFFVPNLAFVLETTMPYAGILWSVGSEEQFYLVWPFIVKHSGRYFLIALLVIIGAFTLAPEVLDYVNHNYLGGKNQAMDLVSHLILRTPFNCMATGALFAFTYKHRPQYFNLLFNPVVQVAVIVLTLALWVKNVHVKFNDEIYSVLFAIIISNLALNSKSVLNLENRVLNYLGKISYGLYVYHLIVCGLVNALIVLVLGHEINRIAFFGLCLISVIGVASLSYEVFEKYFLKIKERRYAIVNTAQAN